MPNAEEVKRYDNNLYECWGGPWVKFTDYADLRRKLEEYENWYGKQEDLITGMKADRDAHKQALDASRAENDDLKEQIFNLRLYLKNLTEGGENDPHASDERKG